MQTKRFAFLIVLAAVLLPGSVSAQTSKTKAMTFALGVNSGFASTQAYEPASPSCSGRVNGAREALLGKAMSDADTLISALRGEGIELDSLSAELHVACTVGPS